MQDISAKYEPTVDDWYTHHILTKGKVKLVSLTSELVKVPNKKKHIITVDIASKKMVFMNEIIWSYDQVYEKYWGLWSKMNLLES